MPAAIRLAYGSLEKAYRVLTFTSVTCRVLVNGANKSFGYFALKYMLLALCPYNHVALHVTMVYRDKLGEYSLPFTVIRVPVNFITTKYRREKYCFRCPLGIVKQSSR